MGRAVRNRMRELELSQAELVRRSGLSEPTVNAITRGAVSAYRDATLLRLVVALGWSRDSVDRLREGHAPVVSGGGETATRRVRAADESNTAAWGAIRRLEERVDALAAEVAQLRAQNGDRAAAKAKR